MDPIVPAALRELAARAAKQSAWPQLRVYAESQKAPEERALAYFALGYREYEAGDYGEAAQDLRESATSRYFLADYATYYSASASLKADNPGQAAEPLLDFASNFPASPLRLKALESLAQALMASQKPQEAIQILTREPNVRQHPELSFQLAKAYEAAGGLPQAARAFQEIYFAYPAFSQAQEAGEALGRLSSVLGASFPQATEEIETARLGLLFKASLFEEALQGYEKLLAARPGSARVGEWQLGRARCLLSLHRDTEAGGILSVSLATPALNEERLALLVEAEVREDNSSAALADLSQIQAIDAHSEAYESALYSVASLFFRLGDWQTAGRQYQALVDSFPQGSHVRDARWRLVWCFYLAQDHVQARQALFDYLAHYADSPRTAAVLYWLGRLAEEQGDASDARALYSLLHNRFAHSYYAVQASLRERKLPAGSSAGMPSPASPAQAVAQEIPPRDSPPISPCSSYMPAELLQPVVTLRALSLDGLAENYLRGLLSAQPGQPQLRVYLSQLEVEQGNVSAGLLDAIKIEPDYSNYQFSELPREMWDLLFPVNFWSLVQRQARANHLDPYLVMGLIRQESAFSTHATSSADARGLMQILPKTASHSQRQSRISSTGRRLYDANYNVRFGCSYLRSLLKEFGGKPELALAAYNAGDFRVKDWMKSDSFRDSSEFLEAIPIHATRAYVEAVLRDAAIYRQLLTRSAKFAMCGKQ